MGHGDRWETVGSGDSRNAIEQYVSRLCQSGAVLTGSERTFDWPAYDHTLEETFVAAPIGLVLQEGPFIFCAITLPRPNGEGAVFMTAYPSPREGMIRRMVIRDLEENCLGLEAWIHAETESEVPIRFFATDYFLCPRRYAKGSIVEVSLSGLAYSMQAASLREVVIDDAETTDRFRELSRDSIEDKPLRVATQGAAVLLPMEDWEPSDYKFQGPLKQRTRALDESHAFSYLTVTVARTDADEINMLVLTGDYVLTGALPDLGQDVSGNMSVMGRLASFDWPT